MTQSTVRRGEQELKQAHAALVVFLRCLSKSEHAATRSNAIAARLGIGPSTWTGWRNGTSKPHYEAVRRAFRDLGLDGHLTKTFEEEVACEMATADRLRWPFPEAGPNCLPGLAIPSSPDGLILRWAAKHLRISAPETLGQRPHATDAAVDAQLIVRIPKNFAGIVESEAGTGRHDTPFCYMSLGQARKLSASMRQLRGHHSVLVLDEWLMTIRPSFCLLEQSAGQAKSTGSKLFSAAKDDTRKRDKSRRSQLDSELLLLRKSVAGKRLVVEEGTVMEDNLDALLRAMDAAQSRSSAPRTRAEQRLGIAIVKVPSTSNALFMLSNRLLQSDVVVVGGHPQMGAVASTVRETGVTLLASDENGALEDAVDGWNPSQYVIAVHSSLMDDRQKEVAATYYRRLSVILKDKYEERFGDISGWMQTEYEKYGGAGKGFEPERLKSYIRAGMNLTLGEAGAFVPVEQFQFPKPHESVASIDATPSRGTLLKPVESSKKRRI